MSADQLRKGRRFAFTILPDWLASAEVSDRAVRIYALIAQHADGGGQAWPSRARLADLAGCSATSVKRAVSELEKVGALTRTQRFGEDGAHRSNLYELHELPALGTPVIHRGGPRVTRGGATGDPGPRVTGDPQNQTHDEPETRAPASGDQLWTADDGRVYARNV